MKVKNIVSSSVTTVPPPVNLFMQVIFELPRFKCKSSLPPIPRIIERDFPGRMVWVVEGGGWRERRR